MKMSLKEKRLRLIRRIEGEPILHGISGEELDRIKAKISVASAKVVEQVNHVLDDAEGKIADLMMKQKKDMEKNLLSPEVETPGSKKIRNVKKKE